METKLYFFTFFCVLLSNTSFHFTAALFSNIPEPMDKMFNISFEKHYGSYLDSLGTSTIWSILAYSTIIAGLLAVFLTIPLIHKKGNKFIVVTLKFVVSSVMGILQILCFILPSFELYIVSMWLDNIIRTPLYMATIFYLNDISPPQYKGITTTLYSLYEQLASVLTMNLTRPSLFGSYETAVYLPIIGLITTVVPSIYLYFLPHPSKIKRRRASTYGSISNDFLSKKELENERKEYKVLGNMEVLKSKELRKILFFLLALQVFSDISPKTIEMGFFARLHEIMGFNQDMIMTIGSIQRIIFLPLFYFTSVGIKRYGPIFSVAGAISILFLKTIVVIIGLMHAYLNGATLFSKLFAIFGDILSGIFTCFGYSALLYLLLHELVPSNAKTSIAQVINLLSMFLNSFIMAIIPFAFNLFPPFPYILLLIGYPGLIIYIYRNLDLIRLADKPEEMEKDVESERLLK